MSHFDVLIVGAGLSGIGAACHLQRECAGKSFLILEARASMGGTWDLFRYPGVRSDSDMYTLGYDFKPWLNSKALADGESIRRYIEETAEENGLGPHVKLGHRVVSASWSSAEARWTVEVDHEGGAGGTERLQLTCGFLHCCTGYYRYDQGFSPEFEGAKEFRGTIVHPQHWPAELDYRGKRVVVIGSGATAVTLVPAMAEDAAHVTMLQRSPTYIVSRPAMDKVADFLRKLLPPMLAYRLVRWKNVTLQAFFFRLSRRRPKWVRGLIRRGLLRELPPGVDIDEHFTPDYEPWDQRLCVVPDGDLFSALRRGLASVVTDFIVRFTANGIELASGQELPADVIVTATGLNVLVAGGMQISVDEERVDLSKSVNYKGAMLSGVPNFALTLGYTNASWTLKADLIASFVCRLLRYMDAHGFTSCVPTLPQAGVKMEPVIDLQSGYVLRALDVLPKQGDARPWRLDQSYPDDVRTLRDGALEGDGLLFTKRETLSRAS